MKKNSVTAFYHRKLQSRHGAHNNNANISKWSLLGRLCRLYLCGRFFLVSNDMLMCALNARTHVIQIMDNNVIYFFLLFFFGNARLYWFFCVSFVGKLFQFNWPFELTSSSSSSSLSICFFSNTNSLDIPKHRVNLESRYVTASKFMIRNRIDFAAKVN